MIMGHSRDGALDKHVIDQDSVSSGISQSMIS